MSCLPDVSALQTILDRDRQAFSGLRSGSRIGIAKRADVVVCDAQMIVLEAQKGRLVAQEQRFGGFADPSLDVMLLGDDEAFDDIAHHLADEGIAALKRQVREGGLACYLMRVQCDLIESGYENFLQSLGAAFLGACR